MPVSYEIDKAKRLVVCIATGVCTADDILGFHEEVVKDRDFDPSFSQLVDGTGITSTDITPSRMRILAERSPFLLTSRRAFVAESQLGFALARVYEIVRGLKGDRQIRVFRNRTAALDWVLQRNTAA